MKKIIALLLAVLMVFAMAACGSKTSPSASPNDVTPAATPGTTTPSAEPDAVSPVVDTVILKEADDKMLNTYSALAVNPDAPFTDADGNPVEGVAVNTEGAAALIKWLLSQSTLDLAAAYGQDVYGDSLFYVKNDAPVYSGEIAKATEETKVIRLSTTTSVNDSGLLGALLPVFEAEYGYTVEVQSAGTGKAIAAAKYGNADLILVHSKSQEEAFVGEGFSYVLDGFTSERISFLYNY